MQSTLTPFEWLSQHLQVLGWPAVCIACFYVGSFFRDVKAQYKESAEELKELHTYGTNHVPHLLEDIKNEIKGQRDDFKNFMIAKAAQREE